MITNKLKTLCEVNGKNRELGLPKLIENILYNKQKTIKNTLIKLFRE